VGEQSAGETGIHDQESVVAVNGVDQPDDVGVGDISGLRITARINRYPEPLFEVRVVMTMAGIQDHQVILRRDALFEFPDLVVDLPFRGLLVK